MVLPGGTLYMKRHSSKKLLISVILISVSQIAHMVCLVSAANGAPGLVLALGEMDSSRYCWKHLTDVHGTARQMNDDGIRREIEDYQALVEKALVYRAESIRVADRLKRKIARDKPLSGADLDTLNQGMIAHLSLRDELYAVAQAHECWVEVSEDTLRDFRISPQDRLTAVMLSLSAALVLYDNYLLAISIFEEDRKLRRLLNARDTGYKIGRAELAKVTLLYNSPSNRHRVISAREFYDKMVEQAPREFFRDSGSSYLYMLISQSPTYNMTKKHSSLYGLGRQMQFFGSVTGDSLNHLGREGVNIFSMLFGNSVGLIETRKGKLYGRPQMSRLIKDRLQAGDILLEKTPFRLTDKFIPGHWGHAAVWIGTEEELRSLGIWDHPLVKKRRGQIRNGQLIVEALRSGVEMSTLEEFLNVDDVGIFRVSRQDKEDTAEIIIRALRQVGKAYDFNFDVETTDRIVCSELIYAAYTGIDWPTEKALGRATISPDHVALKALNGGPLRLVALFHDGELVRNKALKQLAVLLDRH